MKTTGGGEVLMSNASFVRLGGGGCIRPAPPPATGSLSRRVRFPLGFSFP